MPKLLRGLKLLVQSDPCVESFQQQTGEHVIIAAGELHLEICSVLIKNWLDITCSTIEMLEGPP